MFYIRTRPWPPERVATCPQWLCAPKESGSEALLSQETLGASSTLPVPYIVSTDKWDLPGAPRLPTQTLAKTPVPAQHCSEHLLGRSSRSQDRLSRERREQVGLLPQCLPHLETSDSNPELRMAQPYISSITVLPFHSQECP